MALVLLNCEMDGYYLLPVPEEIAANIEHYRSAFDYWMHDIHNDHGYWGRVYADDEFAYLREFAYDGYEAFPRWLNEYVLQDSEEKAVCLPRLDF